MLWYVCWDTKDRRKAIVKLTMDIAKETIRDSSAIVGGAVGFSAYEAVDESHKLGEIVSSIGIGGSLGAKVSETAIHIGEETVGAGSDLVKSLKGKLEDDRDGRNPVKLNKK